MQTSEKPTTQPPRKPTSKPKNSFADEFIQAVRNGNLDRNIGLDQLIHRLAIMRVGYASGLEEIQTFLDTVNIPGTNLEERHNEFLDLQGTFRNIRSLKTVIENGIEPVKFVVRGVIVEKGTTLLCADPKGGKTTLCLNFAHDTATGGKALNSIPLGEPRRVLYIGYENSDNSIGNIALSILQGKPCPELLDIVTEWNTIDKGGLDDLHHYLVARPDTAIIFIDTLGRFQRQGRISYSYSQDVKDMGELHTFAMEHEVAILINHHARKPLNNEDNPIHMVSGTQGIAGSVDTVLVLTGHHNRTRLFTAGRDIEINDYSLGFDEDTKRFTLISSGKPLSSAIQEVLSVLKESGGCLSPREISRKLGGVSVNAIQQRLERLHERKLAVNTGHGQWKVTGNHPSLTEYEEK